MALITMPAVGVRDIQWTYDAPAQLNRSEISGLTGVVPLHAERFSAQIVVAVRTVEEMRAWRSFLIGLRGPVNTFHLPAIKPNEQAGVPVVSVTAVGGSTGNVLATTGWGLAPNTLAMRDGMMIDHAGRLHVVRGDASTKAGNGTLCDLMIEPQLVGATTAGALVRVRAPVGTMRLAGNAVGWLDEIVNYRPATIDCEEAF
jgi:hypothetical protein